MANIGKMLTKASNDLHQRPAAGRSGAAGANCMRWLGSVYLWQSFVHRTDPNKANNYCDEGDKY